MDNVCDTTIGNNTILCKKDNTTGNKQEQTDDNNGSKRPETDKLKTKYTPGRIECPCHNYTALSKIVNILSSGDRTHVTSMIEWLDGSTDEVAIREKKLLTCGKRFKCRFRYGTSFAILRAIRDACVPFQTTSTETGNIRSLAYSEEKLKKNPASSKANESNTKHVSGSISYDESFPPLRQHPGLSNILLPPSGGGKHEILVGDGTRNEAPGTMRIVKKVKGRKIKPTGRAEPQERDASASTVPSPTSDDAAILTDNNPQTSLDQGERNLIQTVKPNLNQSLLIDGRTTIIKTPKTAKTKSKRRLRPQLIVATAPSTPWSPCLGRSNPESTAIINTQNATIEKESETDDLVMTPTKSSTKVTETAIEQMDRLVIMYVALIRNMLVPSTPLEMHLLLELLSIDLDSISIKSRERSQWKALNQSTKSEDEKVVVTGPDLFFQHIFYAPERCIYFAKTVLTRSLKGIIKRLSPFLIKALLGDSAFVRRCPAVADDLNKFLRETTSSADWIPPTIESITGTHAIFSLPFEPERDSRHNFKTPEEISMYQNREATRDAFLSQLRVFITAKSKVFLPQQVDEVREIAQHESRKIIANVTSNNMLWFAQFFCDLLLQVGLAPVEEMDRELLQIIADDRDKLQKLHKRFLKKSPSRSMQTRAGFGSTPTTTGRRNERYRKHNDGKSNGSKRPMMLAFQEALSYFPGYQEFFFIFLHSVNSYNFGMHFLHHVVKKTSDILSDQSLSGIEKRILKLGLLARFLGVLIFSPNWLEQNIDLNKLKPCIHSVDHGLNLLQSIGLPLLKLVQESWDGGYTFIVVPWVTELLKMSKWDSISQSSMNFRQILANLRFVQSFAARSSSEEYTAYGSNMQQVCFHLETFFNGFFSLPKLTSLPDATLVRRSRDLPHYLDNQKIRLSKTAIYFSSPYMEDLCDMIMISKQLIHGKIKSPSIKPRKLKPSTVSTIVGTEARSYLGTESPTAKNAPPLSEANRKGTLVDSSVRGKKIHAQNKLAQGFFHQHRDLKEICDFIVQQTMKTISTEEIGIFVMKASEEFSIGNQSTETSIEEMQVRAFELSQEFLRKKLTTTLTKGLELLSRTVLQQRVIDVATSLSTDRGIETSEDIVRDLIASSTKTFLKQLEITATTPNDKSEKIEVDIDQAIQSATASIRNLTENYSLVAGCNSNIKYMEEALDRVEFVTKSVLIPREVVLRDFFECVLGLDPIAESIIKKVLQSDVPESWIALCTLFRLLEHLALISGYWRSRMNRLFGDDLVKIMSNSKFPSSSEKTFLLKRLTQLSLDKRKCFRVGNSYFEYQSKYKEHINPLKIQFN